MPAFRNFVPLYKHKLLALVDLDQSEEPTPTLESVSTHLKQAQMSGSRHLLENQKNAQPAWKHLAVDYIVSHYAITHRPVKS